MRGELSLKNAHRIAIRVEAVVVLQGGAVVAFEAVDAQFAWGVAQQTCDHGHQRAFGEVEVGEHAGGPLPLVAGGDEDARVKPISGVCGQAGVAFDGAGGGGAYAEDAMVDGTRCDDASANGGGHEAPLAVHVVLFDEFTFDAFEGAQAYVQRDFFARDVLRGEASEKLGGEVQACGGSGDGTFGGLQALVGIDGFGVGGIVRSFVGVDGLVAIFVVGL